MSFQSRNRDAFLFKRRQDGHVSDDSKPSKFQSRNRDAFLFKAGR